MTMNNELERRNYDLISGTMGLLSCNLPEGTEESHENPNDSQYPGQDSDQAPLRYKSEVLPLEPTPKNTG
jgi:hypothetical protein